VDIEMSFYVETISSGHRNGIYEETICSGQRNRILRGDHMHWTEKWAYAWRPYAVAIEMGLHVKTICSGHRNGVIRGGHMTWP